MSLENKLDEIRKKPEHIRMRYVWLSVAVVMVFVIIIWIFSLKSSQNNEPLIPTTITNSDVVGQFQEQKDSLKNTVGGVRDVLNSQDSSNN
jgi:hypothetical protein